MKETHLAEQRVHAMSMRFRNLCGSKGRRTSLVHGMSDKKFWAIVTCKTCLRIRRSADYG